MRACQTRRHFHGRPCNLFDTLARGLGRVAKITLNDLGEKMAQNVARTRLTQFSIARNQLVDLLHPHLVLRLPVHRWVYGRIYMLVWDVRWI